MADGKIITGFSQPYVALYSASGTTITYSSGQKLARGVSVSIAPEVTDNNDFHGDNIVAESIGGKFNGGVVTLTVDGLFIDVERLIMGLSAPTSPNVWTDYGDDQEIPYVGIGFIVRYMEDGVESFAPVALPKCRFNTHEISAQTQGESIDWQTTELTANIFRNDEANHVWKKVAADQTTEAAAVALIKTLFSIT